MASQSLIIGPTFEEMLHPWKISPGIRSQAQRMRHDDPLDPINLFNITWRTPNDSIAYLLLPKEFTGVDAPIAVLYSKDFPTGSHKVGAAYSVLVEKELTGEVDPARHTLVWPSTGNYGIGGAWVGCRMHFDSLVILPELMSTERFDIVRRYGARLVLTPGCESNVKEIYDKCKELVAEDPERVRVLNQFEEFGNYRFHYFVTGNAVVELAEELLQQGVGRGKVAAFCSAMGSAGTIGAGDRLKQAFPDTLVVGLEPVQCPTLILNGYGAHDIQGIGDKHVTWIHNVMNMDAMMAVDDMESKLGLQVLIQSPGPEVLARRYGVPETALTQMRDVFGISGVCNVLGAIKIAKYYRFGPNDLIVTVCTDARDRYGSVMAQLTDTCGPMDETEAAVRFVSVFQRQKTDWVQEGDRATRLRWHHLKYYTWVEQHHKDVRELDAQLSQEYWVAHQERLAQVDQLIIAARGG